MTLDECIDKEFEFYGADGGCFKLDDHVFEAVEDEEDGYRSCLKEIREVVPDKQIFFKGALDTVTVKVAEKTDFSSYGDDEGFKIVSTKDGHHVWLKVGTANTSDYYPWYVFEYQPRAP